MSQYITHRDPRFWEDPNTFRPERFSQLDVPKFAYFPFSMGPRHCIGEHVAMTEALIIIGTLVKDGGLKFEAQPFQPVCEVILRPREPLLASFT